ncbi:stepping stone [Haematobia irritans]|uniref:stepping stone n=1 Tax=Haematobia irritans TaxID=7368 RepID=UPI003F4FC499
MHLKLKSNSHTHTLESRCQKRANRQSLNMASSLVNDDEDNTTATTTTRTTQQQQQQQTSNKNNNNCLNQQNNNTSRGTSSSNNNNSSSNTSANANLTNKMQGNEAKVKKENLQQRKLELEKLLNEKNWLLQQLQKQETEILNGNFEYMNFNDFIQDLASQYKQEQGVETGSSLLGLGGSQFSGGEEAILRRKPLTAKENQQQQQQQHHHHHNALYRRQSEISNRSSEYDNYPHQDNLSTHSEGGGVGVGAGGNSSMTMQHAQQAQQQYNPKSALKKRSATVAGTTQKSTNNLQMVRHQHLDHQQLLYKQQQQHYHHPQQHLFKHHMEHHQVLMPHLQYATQKFYYTTLQAPTTITQQQEYGRYIAQPQHHHSAHNAQNQTSPSQSGQKPHNQMPSCSQATTTQQHLLMTPPHGGGHMDNISLYSLNSNNVATLHRQAEKQQPVIVQCDKYYLSPTTHHVSHNDGGGFIKSSQNIKEYISPINSPQQQLMAAAREKRLASQGNNVRGTVNTPVMDIISLAPSYMSMESVEYMQPIATNIQQSQNQQRWRSQSNLPPSNLSSATAMVSADVKSYSSDMLNNNQYYNTNLNPPPAPASHPPNVTQVKPFKPLDEISLASYSSESQKKPKAKQWLESSLDGPVIRQTPNQGGEDLIGDYLNNNNSQQRSKLSSHSLNTSRHYSMSAAQAKPLNSPTNHHNAQAAKLSQSTSYLNQLVETTPHSTLNSVPVPSISQAYNVEATSPQTPVAYKLLPGNKPPARPPLYINAGGQTTASPTTGLLPGALSPDIRVESPKNVTVVQPATFQPYKEVTKPFEMSDFYKYSTKYRQKENNNTAQDN